MHIRDRIILVHPVKSMVSMIDGNSGIGVHVVSEIGDLTCLRHFKKKSTAAVKLKIIFANTSFPSNVSKRELPSNISPMVQFTNKI